MAYINPKTKTDRGESPRREMCECGKITVERCHSPKPWEFVRFGCLWACRPVSDRSQMMLDDKSQTTEVCEACGEPATRHDREHKNHRQIQLSAQELPNANCNF